MLVLSQKMAREANEIEFKGDAVGLSNQLQARALVGDADETREQRHGFAEIFRGGSDVEHEPDGAWVSRLGEVKAKRAVPQGLGFRERLP